MIISSHELSIQTFANRQKLFLNSFRYCAKDGTNGKWKDQQHSRFQLVNDSLTSCYQLRVIFDGQLQYTRSHCVCFGCCNVFLIYFFIFVYVSTHIRWWKFGKKKLRKPFNTLDLRWFYQNHYITFEWNCIYLVFTVTGDTIILKWTTP